MSDWFRPFNACDYRNMEPGDIVEDEGLGRGMVVYDEEDCPVVAFPRNPDLVLCNSETLKLITNIDKI